MALIHGNTLKIHLWSCNITIIIESHDFWGTTDFLLYMLAGIGTTSLILGIMILSIFTLDQLGIKIEYRDEN